MGYPAVFAGKKVTEPKLDPEWRQRLNKTDAIYVNMVRNQYSRNHTKPPASKILAGLTNSMRVTKSEVMRLYLLCRLQKQEGSREAPHPYNATPPTKKSAVFSPSVFYNVPRPSLHRCLSKPSCHDANFTEHLSPGGSDEDSVQTATYKKDEGMEENIQIPT